MSWSKIKCTDICKHFTCIIRSMTKTIGCICILDPFNLINDYVFFKSGSLFRNCSFCSFFPEFKPWSKNEGRCENKNDNQRKRTIQWNCTNRIQSVEANDLFVLQQRMHILFVWLTPWRTYNWKLLQNHEVRNIKVHLFLSFDTLKILLKIFLNILLHQMNDITRRPNLQCVYQFSVYIGIVWSGEH